jgi:transposase
MAGGDLTDAQWEWIRRYVPVSGLGRLPRNLRKQIDGVNWRFRTGSPWRDVPERYGRWATVYDLHRRYCENGTWLAILLGIVADAQEMGEIDWFVSVDSTTVRAHQHASGAVVDEADLRAALQWLDKRQTRRIKRRMSMQFRSSSRGHLSPRLLDLYFQKKEHIATSIDGLPGLPLPLPPLPA